MRTQQQISAIKQTVTSPYSVENFLSQHEVDHLVKLFEDHQASAVKGYEDKIYKNTGPVTLNIKQFSDDIVVQEIFKRIQVEIGKHEITAGFFFWTDYPHIIHNDDTFELPDTVYKAFAMPLKTYGSNNVPKLCFFDQFYFHGPAKFFKGDNDIPTYYNKQVYDYADVDGLVDTKINDDSKLFTHLKAEWLEGLSVHSIIDWMPTTAIIFDSTRLHCASDFRRLGIKSKLGISIFTKR